MQPQFLRDKGLAKLWSISPAEIGRRRSGDPSRNVPSDPDFPESFLIGPGIRVTRYEDAIAYGKILEERAKKALPIPGRRPRGRPRKHPIISESPAP